MGMTTLNLKLTGQGSLLMHSDRGANPFDPLTREFKKLATRGKKTDELLEQIARLEWELGLYFDEKDGPIIPTPMIRAALVDGAKKLRLGSQVKGATLILESHAKLQYTGPRTIKGLWDAGFRDMRTVVVGQSRIMRCRPVFSGWSLSVDVCYDAEVIQEDQLMNAADMAGHGTSVQGRARQGHFSPAQ